MRRPDLRRLRRPERAEEKFLGPLEAEVMDRLWKRRSATVRDIVDDLARSRELAYTTVMTIMGKLHEDDLHEQSRRGERCHETRRATTSDDIVTCPAG